MRRGQRPTVMLTGDPHFGHRHSITGAPLPGSGFDIGWDISISHAFEVIEMFTRQNGLYQWQVEDPEQRIGADRKIDPFQQTVDNITGGKNYQARQGEYFVPHLSSGRDDEKLWTYADWRKAKIEEMLGDGRIE